MAKEMAGDDFPDMCKRQSGPGTGASLRKRGDLLVRRVMAIAARRWVLDGT